nr:hypothetical protein Z963_p0048 [Clostridium botulinum C/D str. It1]
MKYDNGIDTGGTVTNYKPPVPVDLRKGNKSLHGYTIFQDAIATDTLIKFSIAFETHTKEEIDKFKLFRSKYSERFIFLDEFGTEFRGYLQGKIEIDTPIEGDIYYISLEMLCPCGIDGWKGESNAL